jgi:hypothetical protein
LSGNIISYIDMCRREGTSLQQGMNFGTGGVGAHLVDSRLKPVNNIESETYE